MPILTKQKIILASGSETRRKMLLQTGIEFTTRKPLVDEEELKKQFKNLELESLGFNLASAKALSISQTERDSLVIGADQIAQMDDRIFDKPLSFDQAFKDLQLLSGSKHYQHCFTVIYQGPNLIWQNYSIAELEMRELNPNEISSYINLEHPFNACGSFMFERHGKHLFKQIKGDQDTILGLPIVPLLNKLYELKALEMD